MNKSPEKEGAAKLNFLIKARLAQWKLDDLTTLFKDYEKDVILNQTLDPSTTTLNCKEAIYKNIVEIIRLGQLEQNQPSYQKDVAILLSHT